MNKPCSFLAALLTALTIAASPAAARELFTPPPIFEHLDGFGLDDVLFREAADGYSDEYIDFPEEEEPDYRAPIETALSDSRLIGLEEPKLFYPNKYYDFTVTDTGENLPLPYVKGDVRHVPLYWSTAANPDLSQRHTVWKIGSSAGISEAASYNLYVWYYRMTYNGSDWITGPLERNVFSFSAKAYSLTEPEVPSLNWDSSYQKIRLNWTNAYLADGYELAVREGSSGSYTVTDVKDVLSYTLAADTGTPYYFRIRSYYTPESGNSKTYSSYSPVIKVTPALDIPVLKKAVQASAGKARITWKKVKGADGYQVYVRTSKGEEYTKAKGTTALTVLVSSNGSQNLYVRVRAYRNVNGRKVFSVFTNPVRIRMDG